MLHIPRDREIEDCPTFFSALKRIAGDFTVFLVVFLLFCGMMDAVSHI